ncbi:MAG TPA: hypothetical protein DIT67_11360 [Octadecabacter sp.]|nr:hypothetical protein [Octadecabacter sp.]
MLVPTGGCGEWDRPSADLYDPDGLVAFCVAMEGCTPDNTELHKLECHINDAAFADKALEIFDDWVAPWNCKEAVNDACKKHPLHHV